MIMKGSKELEMSKWIEKGDVLIEALPYIQRLNLNFTGFIGMGTELISYDEIYKDIPLDSYFLFPIFKVLSRTVHSTE